MASASSNLSELTVTCRQCGSASMERIGPREYRCTHCGAITVVSQETDARAATAGIDTSGAAAAPVAPDPAVLTPGEAAAAESIGRHLPAYLFGFCVLLAIFFVGLMHACGGDDKPGSSTNSDVPTPSVPSVPAAQLTLTPAVWTLDVNADGKSSGGRYTSLIANRSSHAVTVPVYSMSLYLRGTRVDTAASTVPVGTLEPGEYEPISFAFKSPSDDPHPEIVAPPVADQAATLPVPLQFNERQLVRQEGKHGYFVVGVLNNASTRPARSIVAAVMLFDASHTLIGYGSYRVNRSLRAGDRTAIQVDILTSNVNPVASYEYLIDAAPDT